MSEKILIIGKNSKISKELLKKIPKNKTVIQPSKYVWNMEDINFDKLKIASIKKVNKILLLQSFISSIPFLKRNSIDIQNQVSVNLLSVVKICEIALQNNKNVKIIIPKENLGWAKAVNIGIKESKTQMVFISQPDVKLIDNCVDKLIECIKDFKDFKIPENIYLTSLNYDTGLKSAPGEKNTIIEALKIRDINSLDNNNLISINEHDIMMKFRQFY